VAKLGRAQVMVAQELIDRGVAVRQVARQLGVTEGALRYRLRPLQFASTDGW
jgi:predicted transcriptional regulator